LALTIKDSETEKLAAEVAALTGENKTSAVKIALRERKERLAFGVAPRDRTAALIKFLEEEVWPCVPRSVLGKRMGKGERARILGY
jgi:antitoxin VapB